MDIQALRQERAKLYSEFEAISAVAEAETRELTEEEDKTFSDLEGRIKTLDGRIRTAERQQALRAATAIPATNAGTPADPEDPHEARLRIYPEPRERPEPGIRFAQITRALSSAAAIRMLLQRSPCRPGASAMRSRRHCSRTTSSRVARWCRSVSRPS